MVQNSIILHDNARSHTTAVTNLLSGWQWEILEHPPYSPNMSPCDYDLFAKVKEPLRGTRHNIRDELIRTIGWSIRNINKMDALMVYDAFQTFEKGDSKGGRLYRRYINVVPLWIKLWQKYRTVAITFYLSLVCKDTQGHFKWWFHILHYFKTVLILSI